MAAINTTFGFKDQITQSISMLNKTLRDMNGTLAEMRGQMSGANAAMDSVAKSAENTAGKVGGISTKMLNFNMAAQAFRTVKGAVDSLGQSVSECSSLYNFQTAQETKLESVMRSRMKASDEAIQSIKDFASAQQQIGVVGDEVQLAGAQELATYLDNAETLKTLLPMLNDLAVQASAGGEVTAQLETSLATMVGKVMEGNLSGMSRRGWSFTDEQKAAFEQMNEAQRAQFLAGYARDAIGSQNADFARTAQGQMMQLKNQIGDMKEEIGRAVLPFAQLKAIVTAKWQISFYQTIVNALDLIRTHINQVIIVLGALGAAIATVGAAFLVLKSQAITAAIASAVAWAAAHLPLLAIVGIILLLITVIATLLVFSSKTFPVIGGFIGGVAGIAKEVGAQIKYYFQVAIEGIVNGFLTMKNKVVGAFLTMFDFLLSGVEKVAYAVDAVFGTSFADNIAGFRETLSAMRNQEQVRFSLGWEDNRRGFANAWAEGQAAGRQTGADLADKMNGAIDKLTKRFKTEQDSIKDGMADVFSFDSQGALLTKESSDVDIADDFRELIRKRATDKYDIRMSQVTPNVVINGVTITGEMSYEEFEERFKEAVREAADSSLRESA